MVFSSSIFLFVFLPFVLIGYFLIKDNFKNSFLMIMSLIFYAWGEPRFVIIMILSIVLNYSFTIAASWSREHIGKHIGNIIFTFTIICNLGILFYFKYFDFFLSSLNAFVRTKLPLREIVLPIGISFFTFQGMSYVIDAYTGKVPVQKKLLNIALYISMFPQLIAGPIVRYIDVNEQIDQRKSSIAGCAEGIRRFSVGLAKKAIIANQMAFVADSVFNLPAESHLVSVAWLGSICYALQIYFDFSGYSDMAIGLGKIFGFDFLENFNYPYISKNITEFWRRWHISLSSWFRDYVYIPLGGNRKHVYINLAIVFILTGIWHGASWHFLVWGIWNGFFILLERYLSRKSGKSILKDKGAHIIKHILKKVYTLTVVNLGWILFRAPSTKEAVEFIFSMFGVADANQIGYTLFWYLDRWTLTVMIAGIFFSTSIPSKIGEILTKRLDVKVRMSVKYVVLVLLFYLTMLRIVSGTYNPFIYFQF